MTYNQNNSDIIPRKSTMGPQPQLNRPWNCFCYFLTIFLQSFISLKCIISSYAFILYVIRAGKTHVYLVNGSANIKNFHFKISSNNRSDYSYVYFCKWNPGCLFLLFRWYTTRVSLFLQLECLFFFVLAHTHTHRNLFANNLVTRVHSCMVKYGERNYDTLSHSL